MNKKISVITLSALVMSNVMAFDVQAAPRGTRSGGRHSASSVVNKTAITTNIPAASNSKGLIFNGGGTKTVTCDAGFYKSGTNCIMCTAGNWCESGATSPSTCSNLPNNATYSTTVANTTSDCAYDCDDGFSKQSDGSCKDATTIVDISDAKNKFALKLQEATAACAGIADDLKEVKGWIIGTNVLGVTGTLTAGGALASNIVKMKKTESYVERGSGDESKKKLSFSEAWEKFDGKKTVLGDDGKTYDLSGATATQIENGEEYPVSGTDIKLKFVSTPDDLGSDKEQYMVRFNVVNDPGLKRYDVAVKGQVAVASRSVELKTPKADEKKAKKLANLTTGLLVGSAASNVGSMTTSLISINKVDSLISKMKSCNSKVGELKLIKSQLEALEVPADDAVVAKGVQIASACDRFDISNMDKVKGLMTSSTITSVIGGAASVGGTVTSIKSESKVRDTKESHKLNVATNVLAGVATGAGVATTATSAVSIASIDKDISTAKSCEGALK